MLMYDVRDVVMLSFYESIEVFVLLEKSFGFLKYAKLQSQHKAPAVK